MSKPDITSLEKKSIIKTIESGWMSQGPVTEKFENNLSKYLSSSVAVVNSGSSALICSLLAHEIRSGDTIAVPSFTFIATASTAKLLGINIIPIDIDSSTFNIDLKKLEEQLKDIKIKAVIVVDVAGLPIDIDLLRKLSKKYNFIIIEDAAEALGSKYKNKLIGSFNHTAIFSFHVAKPLTTIEGGCITSNLGTIRKIKQIRDHGRNQKERYVHDLVGSNFRITDMLSSIGIEQIKKINKYILNRNKIALRYKNELKNIEFQSIPNYVTKHSYMLFLALAPNQKIRNKILKNAIDAGIDCRRVWMPIHKQPCFSECHKFNCPVSNDIFERSFAIPIYNNMEDKEVNYVIKTLNDLYK